MTNPEQIVVAKFGGSSVAKYPEKIKEIVDSTDALRKFIVVSAPGKTDTSNEKLTDILFYIVDTEVPNDKAKELILDKLISIGIPFDIDFVSSVIESHLQAKLSLPPLAYRAHIASLGENLAGQLYAKFLGATYLDPKTLFTLQTVSDHCDGKLDFKETQKKWDAILPTLTDTKYVVPGYYGECEDHHTALFSRGGSDLTGAYIAYFSNATLYENFTDSPILSADPRIISNPSQIETITFKELRDLTYSGFSILHHDVVRPLALKNIPIEIRGTSEFPKPGTSVVETRTPNESVLGVAFADGFVAINFYMPGLHEIQYILSDTLNLFRELDMPIEHVSTGIDDISVIIRKKYLRDTTTKNVQELAEKMFGDQVEVSSTENINLGLLTVVGEGMKSRVGISGEIQNTLATSGVNIYAIDQSITERTIIYCIKSDDAKKAVQGIYDTFVA